jgi:hypothetical protein
VKIVVGLTIVSETEKGLGLSVSHFIHWQGVRCTLKVMTQWMKYRLKCAILNYEPTTGRFKLIT